MFTHQYTFTDHLLIVLVLIVLVLIVLVLIVLALIWCISSTLSLDKKGL